MNARYTVAYDLWLQPSDVAMIMAYTEVDTEEPSSFHPVPIIQAVHNQCRYSFKRFYYGMTYWEQLSTVFRSSHPLSAAFHQSFTQLTAFRAMVISMRWLLALTVIAFF